MKIEIERKFLVRQELWEQLEKPAGIRIKQGYLITDKSKSVRVRIYGDTGFLTIKGESQGFSRMELEYPIPYDEAKLILEELAGNVIEKTRYKIVIDTATWEVDVFSGLNEGLIVAEIELESEDEKFDIPDWLAGEVTNEEKYYNSMLSLNPYKNWKRK